MKYKSNSAGICEICGVNTSNQFHHKFIQSKNNRKIYGKLLDERFNLLKVCPYCHASHAKLKKEHIWDESTFRINATINGHKLPAPSKSFHKLK